MADHGVSPGDYKDLVLFLATAGIVVPLFKRLRISPTLGFLGAGVALGPFGLARFADRAPWLSAVTVSRPEEVAQLAEFGVVFLLFSIGLELSWERLKLMRRLVFGLGLAQVVVCAFAIGGLVVVAGQPILTGVAIGSALALSSTAVVMPELAERKRLHSASGRATFAVLLFQDLAVAPILVALTVFGRDKGGFSPTDLFALVPAAAGLAAILVIGRLVLRPMMKSVARARSEELFMAATLLVVIGAGLAAALAGLSMALGAFVAGLLIAETEYRHEIEVKVEPFKGLLLGLFFVSVGIGLDLSAVIERPLLILGVAAGLIALKTVIVGGLSRAFGLKQASAMETALALASGGEFAFVIINQAIGARLIDPTVGEGLLVSATLSLFVTPALIWLGGVLAHRVDSEALMRAEPAPDADKAKVLIVGFGRVGRLIGEMLAVHQIPWRAIDSGPRAVEAGRHDGHDIHFGDAANPELLKRMGLATAPALVVTMDAPEATEAVVASARALRPDLTIVARARDARHAGRLYALGATDVAPETVEASLQLSEALLVDIGVPMGLVIASIHEKRDEYRRSLNRPDDLGGRRKRARDSGPG